MEVQTIEKRGKNIDEAIKAALDELGCEIDDVAIEIIEEPSKGLLGLVGRKPAVVKVSLKKTNQSQSQSQGQGQSQGPEQEVRQVVEDLLNRMKIDYQINQIEHEAGRVRINIVGKDMGLLIGRKGETLNAVQYIIGLILNRNRAERLRVVLDVEDYRKKREESLEALALRLSDKVKRTRKNVVMRPMSSQERRIVHTILQEDPQISTFSLGDEPNRKVVISLKK